MGDQTEDEVTGGLEQLQEEGQLLVGDDGILEDFMEQFEQAEQLEESRVIANLMEDCPEDREMVTFIDETVRMAHRINFTQTSLEEALGGNAALRVQMMEAWMDGLPDYAPVRVAQKFARDVMSLAQQTGTPPELKISTHLRDLAVLDDIPAEYGGVKTSKGHGTAIDQKELLDVIKPTDDKSYTSVTVPDPRLAEDYTAVLDPVVRYDDPDSEHLLPDYHRNYCMLRAAATREPDGRYDFFTIQRDPEAILTRTKHFAACPYIGGRARVHLYAWIEKVEALMKAKKAGQYDPVVERENEMARRKGDELVAKFTKVKMESVLKKGKQKEKREKKKQDLLEELEEVKVEEDASEAEYAGYGCEAEDMEVGEREQG